MRYLSESLSGLFSVKYFKIILSLFLLFPALYLNGQYFGKNKVKYKNMNWKMVKTPHFNIYYYEGGAYLAEFAANVAEDSYREISEDLSWNLNRKIPILIYDSHNDFQQTNVTPGIIEEQVGGFTEIYKSRIVVPFDGSYEEFRHVINHELTHAFQYDILYGKNVAGTILSQVTTNVPLWYMEGMAEYESRWLDPETDIFMRDLLLNGGYVKVQNLWMYGGYLIYKEGQMIEYYLAQTFGKKILGDILFKCKTEKSFAKAVKSATGLTLEELNSEFKIFLRKRYFPYYDKKSSYEQFSTRITKCDSTYFMNAGGSISPNGDYVAFFSDRTGRYSVFLKNIFTNKTRMIIGGEKTRDYEQMHILRPYIGWFPDSKEFAFVTKSGARDCIHIYSLPKRKVIKRISFNLNAIYSPSVSPDGKSIVFTGLENGMEDIYIVKLNNTKSYERLTFDKYDDREPVFFNDSTIVFVSDRPDSNGEWVYGEYSIWAYNLKKDSLYRVMKKRLHNISKPAVYNGDIYFTSDDEGFGNIFKLSYKDGDVEKITDVLCGISNISISSNGRWSVFDGVKGMRKDLYLLKNIASLKPKPYEPIKYNMRYTKDIGVIYPRTKAKTVFSADIMTGYFGYSSYGGAFGQGVFLFSDLYGDNQLLIQTNLGSYNILNGDYYVQYMNLKHRFNIGVAFNKNRSIDYYPDLLAVVLNNNYGIAEHVDYPFDKFTRIEQTINYNYYKDSLFLYNQGEGQFYLNGVYSYHSLTPSVAFVHDDALNGYMGYLSGNLFRLEFQRSLVLNRNMMDYYYGSLDYRHYSTFFKRYTLATRLIADAGGGIDMSQFTISGNNGLRGYEYGEVKGRYVWMLQNEIRFKLLKNITFDNPIPLQFGSIYSAIFLDMGSGFDNFSDYTPFTNGASGLQMQDIKADAGISFRINLGITLLQFDITKKINFLHFEGNTKYTLWLGGMY